MQVLLFNIASGLGLVALVTTIVDQIAIYLLPLREHYYSYKYERYHVDEHRHKLLKKSGKENHRNNTHKLQNKQQTTTPTMQQETQQSNGSKKARNRKKKQQQ